MNRQRIAFSLAAAGLLVLSGCSQPTEETASTSSSQAQSSQTASSTSDEGAIKPVGTILRGKSGTTIELMSVSERGQSTVLAVKFTAGSENLEGFNIFTPVLVYGDQGLEADVDYSITNPVAGIIAAGTPRTVEFGYSISKDKLNPVTLTVQIGLATTGWKGDLSQFKSADQTPSATVTPTDTQTKPKPTSARPTTPTEPSPTLPPDWDKDGDGEIDVDAPVGDVGCDTTQCLIDLNNQGAAEAAASASAASSPTGEGGASGQSSGQP